MCPAAGRDAAAPMKRRRSQRDAPSVKMPVPAPGAPEQNVAAPPFFCGAPPAGFLLHHRNRRYRKHPVPSGGIHDNPGPESGAAYCPAMILTHSCGYDKMVYFIRLRSTSYMRMPPATEAFRDVMFPSMGRETRKSHFSLIRREIPLPSEPMTSPTGPEKSV